MCRGKSEVVGDISKIISGDNACVKGENELGTIGLRFCGIWIGVDLEGIVLGCMV